ncbi:filamentous hemagglutinin N-terminal domain-containing protein, partial [Candidatus Omnitrophota bacterium]
MNTNRVTKILLIAFAIFLAGAVSVFALPKVDEVVSGEVDIELKDANTMAITASDNAIINFQSFDIMKNESVLVTLPTVDSQILNRVLGNDPSDLLGNLECNGLFILVNESGIYVAPDATISAGSIILSTRDISDTNFVNKEYLFKKLSPEQLDMLLLNEGEISITNGGFGVLVAGAVENKGIITAPAGKVVLAGGDAITLAIADNGRISVAIDEETASTIMDYEGRPITDQIQNTGTIEAAGGTVILEAKSITDIFRCTMNLEGVVMANKIEAEDGQIRVVADRDVILNAEMQATTVEVLSDDDIIVKSNIITDGGDIILYADQDKDSTGELIHLFGTIEATGIGNIYLDGSGEMTLLKVKTENGGIFIGTKNAPEVIRGQPDVVHAEGKYLKLVSREFHVTSLAAVTHLSSLQESMTVEEVVYMEKGELVAILGQSVGRVVYLKANDITLEVPRGDVNTAPGVVIPGNQVKISAQKIGSHGNPVGIDANLTYINRIQGIIDVSEMWGMGSTITIRGPAPNSADSPWGAVSYRKNSELVLDAEKVTVSGVDSTYLLGNITFHDFECTTPGKEIYFEAGKTYTFKGVTDIYGQPGYDGLIKLFSSEEGTPWYSNYLNPLTTEISYVAIRDAHNIGEIVKARPSTNWGNSYNWDTDPVWDGGGDGSYWSEAANWDTDTIPTLSDVVTFNTTSHKDSIVDTNSGGGSFGGTITTFTINGYAGTITLERSLTISENFTQDAGTLDADGYDINVGGNWTKTGGTFTPNSNTVTFNGDAAQTISGATTWYNLTIANTYGNPSDAQDVEPNAVQTVTNLLTISDGQWSPYNGDDYASVTIDSIGEMDPSAPSSTIYVSGDWSNSGTFTHNTSTVILDGTAAQQVTTGGSAFSTLNITNTGTGDVTFTDAATATTFTTAAEGYSLVFDAGGTITNAVTFLNTGGVTFADSTTLTLGGALTIGSDVAVSAGSSQLNVGGNWTNSGTFDAGSGTVTLNAGTGPRTITSNDSAFNNLIFGSSATVTFQPVDALDVNGNLTINTKNTLDAATNNVTINVGGNWTNSNAFLSGGTVTFDGTGAQLLNAGGNGPGQDFDDLTILNDSSSGVSLITTQIGVDGTLTIASNAVFDLNGQDLNEAFNFENLGTLRLLGGETVKFTAGGSGMDYNSGTVEYDGTIAYGALPINGSHYYTLKFNGSGSWGLNAALDIDGDLIISAGTLNATGRNINIAGSWANSGIFTHGSATVTFDAPLDTKTITSGGSAFNHVIFDGAAIFMLEDTLDVDGNLTITNGSLDVNVNEDNLIELGGNWVNDDIFLAQAGTVTFDGGAAQTIDTGGVGDDNDFYDVTISNISDVVSLTGINDTDIDGTLTIDNVSATFDIAGRNLTAATLDNSGTLKLLGSETLIITATDIDSGTVEYYGSGLYNPIYEPGTGYYDLTFNHATGTWVLGEAFHVYGDLTITLGELDTGGYSINVGGNWSRAGTFTHSSGTVTFDGAAAQTISGITTWYNLTIANTHGTPGDANDVDPDAAQTVTNLLTVNDGQWQPYTGDDYTSVTIGADGIIKPDSAASITVSGDWSNSETFTHNDGTVTFDGAAAQAVSGATTWYNLTIANTHGTPNDANDVDPDAVQTVEGFLDVSDGQWTPNTGDDYAAVTIGASGIIAPDSAASITVSGDWNRTGTFTANSGTVSFDGAVAQAISGTTTWYNLAIANTHGTPGDANDVDPNAVQTVTNLLTVSAGQWQPYTDDDYTAVTIGAEGIIKPDLSAAITVSGDWNRTGTFTANSGTVTFDGASAQVISGATTWNNLIIANTHGAPDDTNDVDPDAKQTVVGLLTINDGQWSPNTTDDYASVTIGAAGIMKPDSAASITVYGNWTNNGTFTANSDTITFDGDSVDQTITTGDDTFYNLTLNNTAGVAANDDIIIVGALDVDGTLTITDGELDIFNDDPLVTTAGDVSIGAGGAINVTGRTANWTFDGTSVFTDATGSQDLEDVVVDGTSLTLGSSMYVETMTVTAGTLDLADSGYTLTIDGTGTPLSITDTLDVGSDSRVKYTGGSVTNVALTTYHDLEVNGATTYSLESGTTTVAGSLYVTAGTLAIGANTLNITGDVTNAATITLSTGILDVDGNLDVGTLTCTGVSTTYVAGDWNGVDAFTSNLGTVYFNGTGAQEINTGGASFNNVNISNASDNVSLIGNAIDIDATLTIEGIATFDAAGENITTLDLDNSGTLRLVGNEDITITNSMDIDSGTVECYGSGSYSSFSTGNTFYNLTFNGSGDWTLAGTLDVNGNLTITQGTLDADSQDITVAGNWTNSSSGIFVPNTQTVTFDATSGAKAITSNGSPFYHITFNDGGGPVTFQLEDALDVNGDLTITGGSLDSNNRPINVGGNWSNSDTFIHTTGIVVFDGGVTQEIDSGGVAENNDFYNLTISNTSADVSLVTNNIDIDSAVTIDADATLDLAGKNIATGSLNNLGTIKLLGSENIGGVVSTITGNVEYYGEDAFTGLGLGDAYYNLTFDNGASIWTLDAPLDVNGNLTITAGILNAGGYDINVGGNWSNSGTFIRGSGTVTFDATSGTKTITSGSSIFSNIIFNDDDGTAVFQLEDALDVNGNLTITGGTLDTKEAVNNSINVAGNWDNDDIFVARQGTVTFDGSGAQIIYAGGYGDGQDFYNATISNTNPVTVSNEHMRVTGALTVSSSTNFTLALNAQVWVDTGTLTLTGTPVHNAISCIIDHSGATYDYYGGETGINKSDLISSFNATDNVTIKRGNLPQDEAAAALTLTIDFGATYTMTTGDLDVDGDITIVGAFEGANTIYCAGNWTNSGTSTHNNSSIIFDAPGGTKTINTGGSDSAFYNMTFTGPTVTYVLANVLYIDNDLLISGGKLDSNQNSYQVHPEYPKGYDIHIGGDWTNEDAYESWQNTVYFVGIEPQSIVTGGLGGWDNFYNVFLNEGSEVIMETTDARIEQDLYINAGASFSLDGVNLEVLNVFNNKGILAVQGTETITEPTNESGSTVSFVGTSAPDDDINLPDWTYYSLSIDADTGDTFRPPTGTDLTTLEDFTITSGIFNANDGSNDRDITVDGNLSIGADGTFTKSTTGIWTFGGTDSSTWEDLTSSKQDLGAVVIDGTTKTVSTSSDVKATSVTIGADDIFNITDDTLTLIGTGTPLTVNGTFTTTNSTVIYAGSGIATDIATVAYNDLTLAPSPSAATTYNLTGDLTSANAMTGNLTINSDSTLDVNGYAINAAGDVANTGTIDTSSGDITITAANITSGTVTNNVGNISLYATGTTSDLDITAPVTSGTGDITLDADNDVIFRPEGDITSTSGTISVTADKDNGGLSSGSLTMEDCSEIDAGTGIISFSADENITLSGLKTTSASATAVTLTTTEGAIVDGGDLHIDVDAVNGTLVMTAVKGIGSVGAVDT